ncbi:MAG: FAD-dependent oxidoreductase [candidate division Zixibacteria bacterium]|nr:FAD-dependent oxidoreductase [candidate division Zixibacteria bacterium]
MEKSDVVIIGGVAAGPKTAATLARRNGALSITLFQKEDLLSYGSCGLPYFASGDIESFNGLVETSYGIARDADFFENIKGFKAVTGAEVIEINRDEKYIIIKMLKSGETIKHGYDKLVIATGANAIKPPFPVAESSKISSFTRPDDAIAFRKAAQTGQVGKVVIIGGGFIGCEMTEACAGLWGIETVLIERENQIMPFVLDKEMAEIAKREMTRQDIKVLTGAEVQKVELDSDNNPVVYIDGHAPITADYVFLCLGVKPEVTLAKNTGLTIGKTGAIAVNSHLQTSDDNIYAGGDCIENKNKITGQPFFIPMGSLANRHGRVIAENITGNKAEFSGVLGAFLVKVFDTNVGAVGLSQMSAEKAGLKTNAVWGTFPDKPDYYPESQVFVLKLIYDADTKRVLGLQAVGAGDICRRIDSMSALLQQNATLDTLIDFEHGYAPPYSDALDPLHHLAAMAKSGFDFISPLTNDEKDAYLWLDVRETSEFEEAAWPDEMKNRIKNIPLGKLRSRAKELDTGRPILVTCMRGLRSYQAAVILKQSGFDNVHILSGGFEASQQ